VGCGYNVGAPFSQEVRTVAVSIPKSDSPRRFLEMQLTEAVQKQIQQRTHFRLAREGEADTALVLRLTDLQKGLLGQTENSDARELQISLRVAAEWVDRRSGDVLREQSFDLGKLPRALVAQAEYAPEVGQSLATAEREVIDRMARDIVNMMETPWKPARFHRRERKPPALYQRGATPSADPMRPEAFARPARPLQVEWPGDSTRLRFVGLVTRRAGGRSG